MHSFIHITIWIVISMSLPLTIKGSSFGPYPILEPQNNMVIPVNHTLLIVCKIDAGETISLTLNNTEIETNTSYIEYNHTFDSPGLYKFVCRSKYGNNFVEITARYLPRVISTSTVITGDDIKFCKMVVNFTVLNLLSTDYIRIKRYAILEKTFQSCTNMTNICQFSCLLFHDEFIKVMFNIKDVDEYSSNWTIPASLRFYKLDKLKLTKSGTDIKSLNLSYTHTNRNDKSWLKFPHGSPPTVLYRITYSSEWDQAKKNITTKKTDVFLDDLVPYTTYSIGIQAKTVRSIYWSDKTTFEKRTLPSAPYAGPNSTNGSYLEIPCEESKRCFILYWAMIPMPLRNGIFDSFVIKKDGKILFETSEIYAEMRNQPPNKDLWFEIQFKNKNSQSSPPTIIHIPPKALERPKGVSIVQLNNTHVNISWTLEQSSENVNVTVMSCSGGILASALRCDSNMTWATISNENFTILEANGAKKFAVYVSNSEGSSSLTHAECTLGRGIPTNSTTEYSTDPSSGKNNWMIITISLFVCVIFLIGCGFCSRLMFKIYKKKNVDAEYPEEFTRVQYRKQY